VVRSPLRQTIGRRPHSRLMVVILVLVLAMLSLGLILVTPVALGLFPDDDSARWERLSFIGQTYGAGSAILSVIALGGVAVSLLLQSREARAAREQALRALHVDLIKLALDDPLYLGCWGPFSGSTNVDDRRRHMYTNLIVSHWQMMWEIGGLNERHLRLLARELFAGEVGRRFWGLMGDVRLDVEGDRKTRRSTPSSPRSSRTPSAPVHRSRARTTHETSRTMVRGEFAWPTARARTGCCARACSARGSSSRRTSGSATSPRRCGIRSRSSSAWPRWSRPRRRAGRRRRAARAAALPARDAT
jgi:hypothetical protein